MKRIVRLSLIPSLLAALLAGLSGCKSSGVSASSNVDISPGAPTMNERFASRNPRVCAQLMTPPTPAQATLLVQCDSESTTTGMTPMNTLVTDLQVQMSAPRAFKMEINGSTVDTTAPVYDLRGQGTRWVCSPVAGQGGLEPAGQNCMRSDAVPKGIGECFKTTFGDWKCQMTTGNGSWVTKVQGPTTF